MKRSLSVLMLATLAFIGCTPEEQSGTTPGVFDVSLQIPDEITIGQDAESIEFNVIDGKAPKSSDVMILNGPAGQKFCKILSVSSEKTTVELYEGLQEGQHVSGLLLGCIAKVTIQVYILAVVTDALVCLLVGKVMFLRNTPHIDYRDHYEPNILTKDIERIGLLGGIAD